MWRRRCSRERTATYVRDDYFLPRCSVRRKSLEMADERA
jgi:hypothetical protein